MNRALLLAVVLIAAAGGATRAQNPSKTRAPDLIRDMAQSERDRLIQATLLLSKGQFDQASAILKPLIAPAAIRVYADFTPVPKDRRADFRQAVQQAEHNWNAGLAGVIRFQPVEKEEDADVVILFDRDVAVTQFGQARLICSDVKLDIAETASARRTGQARIALLQPYTPGTHSAASITHEVGQALGVFIGLGSSVNPEDIMGPDPHSAAATVKPSAQDTQRALQIQDARTKLMGYAERRLAVYMPRAVIAVAKVEQDAGEVWRGENPRYAFAIRNTGDAPLEIIEAKPNCGCVVPSYDKVIPPGKEGRIEAELRTATYRGRIFKMIDVTSNDPETPKLSLRLLATVKSVITVLPSESPVIGLKDSGPTIHEMTVQVAEKDPVQITNATCTVPYASVDVEPAGKPNEYKLKLTVRTDAPLGRSAFLVSVTTTSKREPQLNITAICEKGILAVPVAAYMGTITPQTVMPVNQIVTLSRREGSFKIQTVQIDDPNIEVRRETLQEGSQYRLMLVYKGGWQPGQVRRKLTVQTDDPRQPMIEIPVMATVVGGGSASK